MNNDIASQIFSCLDRELWLITARAGERQSGLIATNVSNASLVADLPRITVGLAKHHFTHELIHNSRAFCMHLLNESHIDWVWRFGVHSGRDTDKPAPAAVRKQTHKDLELIVEAIAERDGRRAEELVSDHLMRTLATINIWQ